MSKIRKINISEFKSKSLFLLEELHGTTKIIVVTKRGKAIAKVESYSENSPVKEGKLKNTIIYQEDIVEPIGSTDWNATK